MSQIESDPTISQAPEAVFDGTVPTSHAGAILVVDDDRDAADTVAALLEAMGMTVMPAYSARDGLDRLDECPDVRLVISDVRMPGVDGFDFIRVVRHRFPAMPVLLTTGLPITVDDVVPRGTLILQKPFAADELRRAVENQLRVGTEDEGDSAGA